MPPRNISKGTISSPVANIVTATAYKFQLPALNLPQTSLTEGTPIPAPQRDTSPPGSPPQTPLSTDSPNPLRSHPTSSHSLSRRFSSDAATNLNGQSKATTPRTNEASTTATTSTNVKRSYDSSPSSPSAAPPPKRPHIRKLLSLKSLSSLNRSSAELPRPSTSGRISTSVDDRPSSPSPSTSTGPNKLSKHRRRGSSFWRRTSSLGVGLGLVREENDVVMGDAEQGKNHNPAPMLPELEGLGNEPEMQTIDHSHANPQVRRQLSGWFGGEKMFDGIGSR